MHAAFAIRILALVAAAIGATGCASIATTEQARTDAKQLLRERSQAMASPQALSTRYTESLEQFGRLLAVYRKNSKAPLYVQSRNIADATGLSHPLTGSELPADITEMVRSAVNRIGDPVVYVPFQPEYVVAQAQQGARMRLTLPDVLITGAITEFDRALSNVGRGANLSLIFGDGRGQTDTSAARKGTSTISRLSLDFNLVDFPTQTMLPQVQATNSLRVLNETYEDSLDFAIYGNGFGLTTNTRYLQGRHNAVRLLVDLSMVQLLGRYANVPYWRCIPNAVPDPSVLRRISKRYEANDTPTRIKWLQDTLNDYGFGIATTGVMDVRTQLALQSVAEQFKWPPVTDPLAPEVFVQLFNNIPVEASARVAAASPK